LTYAALTFHLYFAMRRVYSESIRSTLWKCVALMAVTIVSNRAMGALATRVTFWLI
jgi:hypothetical protein